MEALSKSDEPFPTPPSYFLPDDGQAGQHVKIYHIHSPFNPLPPFTLSPAEGPSYQSYLPQPVLAPTTQCTPTPKFVSYEVELYRSPALTRCPSCQAQVTTLVTYRVGTHAWLMCLVFVLCGLWLGCCLIPFFMNHFKDAYHWCPRCRRMLHVHRRRCCE